jgi:hypothetical protein
MTRGIAEWQFHVFFSVSQARTGSPPPSAASRDSRSDIPASGNPRSQSTLAKGPADPSEMLLTEFCSILFTTLELQENHKNKAKNEFCSFCSFCS